ncbi:DUF3047 family protein [Panacagrimonas perspica]|uniref:DUF3047 family protein n=1 Tax=Panacagrimonas perspica TaxID=381431 RepID=A0A4R7NXD4_9GAMM|nr:DUF3047 domain-containing protein [Panacagrimonas perspica]TDU25768.1 DUF3047 family protein [Panacagrimonas perspica]
MPIRNAPSALPTTLRFMGSRLARRLKGEADVPPTDFRARIEQALAKLGDAVLRCDWVKVPATTAPWIDSGVVLPSGQTISLLANGMVYASSALDVGFQPKVGLWHRVGDGELAKIVGNASSFDSGAGGTLWLTSKPSGEFADRKGAFEPKYPRVKFPGEFEVAVVQWRGDATQGVQAAATIEPQWFGTALKRLQSPVAPPAGWHYLWRLGQGEIFQPCDTKKDELCCHTSADVGILQYPVDVPLTADSEVQWSWLVEQLPSKLPEHIEPTHDYLSLAVEFDNGLDLTWMWSAALPVDTIFQCPLAWWNERETHWVVRSGTEQLGRWLDERRNIADDYRKAIGGELPKKIVGVWLIANTVFQRGEGKCRYRDIVLEDGQGRLKIAS